LIAIPPRRRAPPLDPRTLAAGIAAWAAAACVAFRHVVSSSFDLIFGDRGDGRLIVYLHEHLFNALQGAAPFLSPPIFYPQQHVLGFSDAYLLDVAPYAALRWLGLDPFLSFQSWTMVLSFFCFVASLIVGTRYLRLRPVIAICAALLVTFPNNLLFKTVVAHSNFFALYYVPCIVLLALWGVEDFPRITFWSLARVGLAAALFGLLFATVYYVAWMFALTALIALCAAGVLLRRDVIAYARHYLEPARALVGAAIVGFSIGAVAVALIYVPVLSIVPGRTFRDYIGFAPFPRDAINVGDWNLVWGWLVGRILGDGGIERTLAVTPGVTAILLALAYRTRRDANPQGTTSWQPTFVAVCVAVLAVAWLATARIGTFSLFWLLQQLLPGASAIRVGGRIQLLVNLWVVAGLAVATQYWIDTGPAARQRYRKWIAGALLGFCLVEQINLHPPGLRRSEEFAWLQTVPNPPSGCQAFLLRVANQPANYLDENDAMWIALKTGLPTLNGSSGWSPPGWRLEDPKLDYVEAARQWIAKNNLEQQVCVFDRSAKSWAVFR
jgi:hypothetical protein